MAGQRRGRPGRDGPDEFTRRLRSLQSGGSTVLVTGSGSSEVHADACRRLLGEGSPSDRRRLLVFTDGSLDVDARLPAGATPGDGTRAITTGTVRSATAAASPESGLDVAELGDASLPELGVAIAEAIADLDRTYGPLEPTELRVGVDSLAPLLDAHGERSVFAFLLLLNAHVRRVDALGHCHLPVDRDSYVVRLLAPLFDAVVEVRVRDGQPQQRWHLEDGSVSSRWLTL